MSTRSEFREPAIINNGVQRKPREEMFDVYFAERGAYMLNPNNEFFASDETQH